MPYGSQIFEVESLVDQTVKAIAVEKDGKHMLAVVNVSKQSKNVQLQSSSLSSLENVKQFIYAKESLIKKGDHALEPNERELTLNLNDGVTVQMPSESLIVYTNFEY